MLNLGQMGETLVLEVKRYTQINWNHSKFSQKVLWLAPQKEVTACSLHLHTHTMKLRARFKQGRKVAWFAKHAFCSVYLESAYVFLFHKDSWPSVRWV